MCSVTFETYCDLSKLYFNTGRSSKKLIRACLDLLPYEVLGKYQCICSNERRRIKTQRCVHNKKKKAL